MKKTRKKIVVMGLGYIGLPTASMFATKGHEVVGVDVRPEVVETINTGRIHITEPDLDVLVKSAVNSGNLRAAVRPEQADAFIVAVPTPFKRSRGSDRVPDLAFVDAATRSIASFVKEKDLVVLESTSPVGTTERIHDLLTAKKPSLRGRIYVAHCPERVLPGHILRELVDNDRIIGGIDPASAEKARDLYQTFCNGAVHLTDSRTAELVKLAENSYRDVNIAFANELSLICERLGVNVWNVIEFANRHPRVRILQPGPGVGGHCIAVDPWFIVSSAPREARLIRTARQVNDSKPQWVVRKVLAAAKEFKRPVIGCLGLSFKADIGDLRESPALAITKALIRSKAGRVMACEPNLNSSSHDLPIYGLGRVLKEANILVVLVDHREFKGLDKALLENKIVLDIRGILK